MPFFCLRLLYFLQANPHETIGIYVTQNDNESNHAAAHTAKQTHTDNPEEEEQQQQTWRSRRKPPFLPQKRKPLSNNEQKNLEKTTYNH